MAEGTIGSVGVEVTPDARGFWRSFEAQTRAGASEAGRSAGNDFQRGFESSLGRQAVNVRVNADTTRARAEIASLGSASSKAAGQSHLLRDAIIALGPAAIPVGAAVAGAFIGAVPALAALALGVSGVKKEFDSGQLAGTKYAKDIHQLTGEFHQLQSIAAGGILTGLDQAMRGSHALFGQFNHDIAGVSSQFGQIAGNIAPALLSLLHDVDPLINAIGNDLVRGSAAFKHWAESSSAVSQFVSYAVGELPKVEQTITAVVGAAAHLVASLAPLGGTALLGLRLLATALRAIPTGVLTKIETGALAVYAAFRTYQGITAIVNRVSGAIESYQARQATAAGVARASALQQEAAQAELAAQTATTNAERAASFAQTQAQIAASVAGTGSILEESAVADSVAADQFAAAEEEKAAAARAAAIQIAAAAEAQAAAVEGSGAGVGVAGAIGPIGALVAGLGVLGLAFASSRGDSQAAAQAMDSYTDSVKRSTDALAQVNIQQTVKNLAGSGALNQLRDLAAGNQQLGVSFADLVQAVNGPADKMTEVLAKLEAARQSIYATERSAGSVSKDQALAYVKQIGDIDSLILTLSKYRKGLSGQIDLQKLYRRALGQSRGATDSVTAAAQGQADAFGVTAKALQNAQAAARKNAASERAQTLQMQLANDAAGLLAQSLDKLAGDNLSYAQAQNAFQQQLVTLRQNLKGGSKDLHGMSSAAVQNRGSLLSLVTGAEQSAEAYGKMTGSSADARQKLIQLRQQIIDNAVAHGEDRKAVEQYVDAVLKIPKHVPPTKLDVKTDAAQAMIKTLQQHIDDIKQGKVVGLNADPSKAHQAVAEAQAEINAIRQGHLPTINVDTTSAFAALARVQLAIQALQDKTITITAYEKIVGITGPGGSADTNSGKGHNTTAIGSAARFGRSDGTIPPNTRFTVGERGWEGGWTDAQGRARIFSHGQSIAMGFSTPVGYAAGTGPTAIQNAEQAILTLIGKIGQGASAPFDVATVGLKKVLQQIRTARHDLEAQAAKGLISDKALAQDEAKLKRLAAFARHQAATEAIQARFDVIGQQPTPAFTITNEKQYQRVLEQIGKANAKVRAEAKAGLISKKQFTDYENQLHHLRDVADKEIGQIRRQADRQISGADLSALKQAIKGTESDARAAFRQIVKDMQAAGAPSKLIDRLRDINGGLDRIIGKRDRLRDALGTPADNSTTAYERLANAIAKVAAVASGARDAIRGSFDITAAGQDDQGKVAGGRVVAQQKQALVRIRKFVGDMDKLKPPRLNKAYWAQLAGQGPSGLEEAEALLHMPKAELAQVNRQEAEVARLSRRFGATAGQTVAGGGVAAAREQIKGMKDRLHDDNVKIGNKFDRLHDAIKDFAHATRTQKADLVLAEGGKPLARVIIKAEAQLARAR
jgi:hypothetical protein